MEPAAPCALVVDDEVNVRYIVRTSLQLDGWEVAEAATAAEARKAVQLRPPDVVVLDVMLGERDGFAFCEELRRHAYAGAVLFLTARDAVDDRVRGLTNGGDDYLVKPFSVEELVARCRLRLRLAADLKNDAGVLRHLDLEIDDRAHRVTRAGKAVDLTPTEYRLLRYLLLNAGTVLSRAQLTEHVWGYGSDGEGSNLESYISFLRRKVDAVEPKLIHTVRSFGYVLRSEP